MYTRNEPDYLLLMSKFCISTTKHISMILEYNCVVWSPHLKQDIEKIERVQRLCGLSNISYSERLRRLQLCSLEQRRLHFDLLMCLSLIHI